MSTTFLKKIKKFPNSTDLADCQELILHKKCGRTPPVFLHSSRLHKNSEIPVLFFYVSSFSQISGKNLLKIYANCLLTKFRGRVIIENFAAETLRLRRAIISLFLGLVKPNFKKYCTKFSIKICIVLLILKMSS
jgi:hypothetical protein